MVALQKIGIKIFSDSRALKSPTDFIPLFHRWIQRNSIPDHLLIDVVDYSHIYQGPGILLMAHEGIFALDQSEGKPGLLYMRKQPLPGNLEDRLEAILNIAVETAKLLETEANFSVTFDYRHFRVIANDRLEAPANEHSFRLLRQVLVSLEERWGQAGKSVIRNVSVPKGRLEVDWILSAVPKSNAVLDEQKAGVL
ncbi:MAG: hypothetical protein GXO92_06240 [FCB group bacterium]|nr:hypothetical protein [FCB group bacterium]